MVYSVLEMNIDFLEQMLYGKNSDLLLEGEKKAINYAIMLMKQKLKNL